MAEALDSMSKEKELSKLDQFLVHIHGDPSKFDGDRKYQELWCNIKDKKTVKLPTAIGMKNFRVTKAPFPEEKLSLWESSAMEEDFLHIAKINIRPEPYDLLRKLFDEKKYEATTRVFIDALVTRITQHNMLQFSVETRYELNQEQTDAPKKSKGQKTNASKKPEAQQSEAAENTATQTDSTEKLYYIIKDINGPMGVVDVEPAKSLHKESITQCMEQLAAIQQEIEEKGRNIPLFGIVTDALHFIFIKLHPDGQFEFESNERRELKVHRANTWGDFHKITKIFNGLCQLHKKFVSPDSLM